MIREDLEKFFYNFLSRNTNYPCILEKEEISHDDIKLFGGYPLIRYAIDEIDTTAEGILVEKSLINKDELSEKHTFNASYMLTFSVYYKSDKPYNIDNLLYELSNSKQFTRLIQNLSKDNLSFKDIVMRGKVEIINTDEYLQEQTISKDRYQQIFIVDVVREYRIPIAKQENIKEVTINENGNK